MLQRGSRPERRLGLEEEEEKEEINARFIYIPIKNSLGWTNY
jgi:hypothetical protein